MKNFDKDTIMCGACGQHPAQHEVLGINVCPLCAIMAHEKLKYITDRIVEKSLTSHQINLLAARMSTK